MRSLLLGLCLAATPAAVPADTAEVVRDHVRPGFAAFAGAAEALARIDTCDPATLRPAFQSAWDAWMAVAHLTLGPAEADGKGLSVLYWPDPKALGWKAQKSLLAEGAAALDPTAFAQQSIAARGLPALERLLYPTETLPADPCPLIHATAGDMARTGAALAADWETYGDLLLAPGQPGNTAYLSEAEARQALFTALATGLEGLADKRLGRPLGTFDKPRPELAEARASGRSLRNVVLSLQALRAMALSLEPGAAGTLAAFDRALALADGLEDPILAGVAEPQGRLKVEILQQSIRSLRETAIVEMAPLLGVTVGFNSADGD
jgi:predicted lipoprotein